MANLLDCNLDFLLGRTDIPTKIDAIENINKNPKLALLFQNIDVYKRQLPHSLHLIIAI